MTSILNSSGDGVASPLDASYYKGQGLRQGLEREFVAVPDKHYWTKQRHDEFISGHVASSLKQRDYKEYTDLVQEENMEEQNRKYVLRRLTPMECARLQGFPDWWCDDANGSDSAQYKLWGNGIALPCACDILGRVAEEVRNNG